MPESHLIKDQVNEVVRRRLEQLGPLYEVSKIFLGYDETLGYYLEMPSYREYFKSFSAFCTHLKGAGAVMHTIAGYAPIYPLLNIHRVCQVTMSRIVPLRIEEKRPVEEIKRMGWQ